jgi:hypothetical protein
MKWLVGDRGLVECDNLADFYMDSQCLRCYCADVKPICAECRPRVIEYVRARLAMCTHCGGMIVILAFRPLD